MHPRTSLSFLSLQDYRAVYTILNSCIQHNYDSYTSNFHFLHIAGLSDTVIQLMGAVLNLDLDTLLDITPSNTSIDVATRLLSSRSSAPSITTSTSPCHGSAPLYKVGHNRPTRTAGCYVRSSHTRWSFPSSTPVRFHLLLHS